MSFDRAMEVIQASDLPNEVSENALDALGFTLAFHSLLSDWGLVSDQEVDVDALEKAFEAILGENTAASIFLASFPNTEKQLMDAGTNLEGTEGVPDLVINGYKKLAERVAKTRKSLEE